MQWVRRVDVPAPAEVVWELMRDVGRWPSWNPAVAHVDLSEEGLVPGARLTLTSTGMWCHDYRVAFVEEGSRFAAVSASLGLGHWFERRVLTGGTDACTVRLTWAIGGLMAATADRGVHAVVTSLLDSEGVFLRERALGA
ncbi:hypothetical protein Acsp07_50300 [Actinomycetospora sp. NBRC 106378]|jgi:hypothetical protein|nr:hypothetical protein Acsp07_50300 [Actinomycetospora sp. NBRC 106378]